MSFSGGNVEGGISAASKSTTTRAVLLLLFAVIVGVGLLHELDKGDSLLATNARSESVETTTTSTSTTSTAPARTPAQVGVLVANGTSVNGLAGTMSSRLTPSGYRMLTPATTSTKFATSQVQYATGYQAEAEAIASVFQLPAAAAVPMTAPAPVTDVAGANVIVVIGEDLAGSASRSGETTPNTTPAGPLTSSSTTPTSVAPSTTASLGMVTPTTTTAAR